MNDTEATNAMSVLIAGTTGWNDEAVELYLDELTAMHDPAALHEACRTIVRAWDESRRPPLRRVIDEYQSTVRRRNRSRELNPAPYRWIPFMDGLRHARQVYERSCKERGVTPNPNALRRGIALVKPDPTRGAA